MTQYQFQLSMKKLTDQWKGTYSAPRIDILYSVVKDTNYDDFERQVTRWLLECKTAPLGQEFSEFARKQNTVRMIHKREELGVTCAYCEGDGRKLVDTDRGLYIFMCNKCDGAKLNGFWKHTDSNGQTSYFEYWKDEYREKEKLDEYFKKVLK